MKHILRNLIFCLLIAMMPECLFGDDDKQHSPTNRNDTAAVSHNENNAETSEKDNNSKVFASFNEFPTLHPFIVHFPIVLIIIAFFVQLVGLFKFRDAFSWLTLFLLIFGFAGALLAAFVIHPPAANLPFHVRTIYEMHETFAYWTVWLSGGAFAVKLISQFTHRKNWIEVAVVVLLAGAATTVSLAGHLGSQMVFIEEVGPGGRYLEQHTH